MPTRDSVTGNRGSDPVEKWMLTFLKFLSTSLGEKTFTVVAKPALPGVKTGARQHKFHVISVQKGKFVIQSMDTTHETPQMVKTREVAKTLRDMAPVDLTVLGRSGDGGPEEKYKMTRDGRVYVVSVDGVEAEDDVRVLIPKIGA